MTVLAIRLPADIESRLGDLAKATGRSKTFYAREAILEYLDDIEDWYLAEHRLQANQSGQSSSRSLADVMRHHGLED